LAALLGLLVGSLALLLVVVQHSPEGQAVVDRVLPARPEGRKWRLPVPRAESASLTLVLVDTDGKRVPGVSLRTAPCKQDTWQERQSDGAGEVTLPPGCTRLEVDDSGWALAGPAVVGDAPTASRAQALVVRRCPGLVEITRDGAPATGEAWLSPGGQIALDPQGRAFFADRLCEPTHVALVQRQPHFMATSPQPVPVRDRGLVHLEVGSDLVPHQAPTRTEHRLAVHLDCSDCPDLVHAANHNLSRGACWGDGQTWDCPCPDGEDCVLSGGWHEALFDWRYSWLQIASVPADADQADIALAGPSAQLSGTWTGPLPCTAHVVSQRTGAFREGNCDDDGTFAIWDLNPGPWQLTVGWTPDDDGLGRDVAQATRTVELDGHDVELGDVGPE